MTEFGITPLRHLDEWTKELFRAKHQEQEHKDPIRLEDRACKTGLGGEGGKWKKQKKDEPGYSGSRDLAAEPLYGT
jgi:hypothetical protein